MSGVVARLGQVGIVPVVKIEEERHAVPLIEALLEGDLPCAEITLRTPAGIAALGRIATEYPQVSVGAGTVLTIEQAERAATAGAHFIVSPGFGADIVEWCLHHEVPIFPGAVTLYDTAGEPLLRFVLWRKLV